MSIEQLNQIWEQYPRHFLDRKCYTQKSIMEDNIQLQSILEKASSNRFVQFWKKHTLQQSDAGAIGELSKVVVEAALPELVGREMCWVVETTESKVRFPRAIKGKAQARIVGGTGQVEIIPERMDFIDIEADTEIIASSAYTDAYLEDAAWPAVRRATEEAGRSVAEKETELIVEKFDSISNSDLAGGAQITLSNPCTMDNLIDIITNVRKEDFIPDKVFMNPAQFGELKKDDTFIDSLKWGELLDKERGEMARMIDGVRIFVSSKINAQKVYAIDSRWACGLVIRRDLIIEPFDKRDQLISGVIASSRIGVRILRSKAVARGAR
ncbi:MAG: phage major capsid protein [Nitrososphaerales archaeon]